MYYFSCIMLMTVVVKMWSSLLACIPGVLLCPNVANFWGLWSNVSNYIVELMLVALAIYGGESFAFYE